MSAYSSSSHESQRNVSVVMSILICAIIVDNLLYAFLFGGSLVKQLTSSFGILLFIIVVAVSYGSALYLLSRFISPLHRQIKTYSSRFNWLYKTLVIAQYASGVLIAIIILELILTSHYYVGLLITATAISFTLSAIIMALSSYRFLSWYKSSNKNAIVLIYGVTFAVTAIGFGVIISVNSSVILLENPAEVGIGLRSSTLDMSQNAKALILYQITYTPSRLGFLLYWIATALLLREYSRKLGRLKFWTIISLPLVSFLSASLFVSPDYEHSLLYDALLVPGSPDCRWHSIWYSIFDYGKRYEQTYCYSYFGILSYYLSIWYCPSCCSRHFTNNIHTIPSIWSCSVVICRVIVISV